MLAYFGWHRPSYGGWTYGMGTHSSQDRLAEQRRAHGLHQTGSSMALGVGVASIRTACRGSRQWRARLLVSAWRARIPALADVLGAGRYQPTPAVDRLMRGRGRKLDHKRLADLGRFDGLDGLAVSIVTDLARDVFDADKLIQSRKNGLASFLRRRLPSGSLVILYPEIDPLRVEKHSTIGRTFPDTDIVWKIHWHGLIHAPGLSSEQIIELIKTTPTGRASSYSGTHSIRVLRAYYAAGWISYARKQSYKPADPSNPFSDFTDWLWLTLRHNETAIRIGIRSTEIKCDTIPDVDCRNSLLCRLLCSASYKALCSRNDFSSKDDGASSSLHTMYDSLYYFQRYGPTYTDSGSRKCLWRMGFSETFDLGFPGLADVPVVPGQERPP